MSKQLNSMLKSIQTMQAKMKEAQNDLEKMYVTGDAGGGMVKITMTCKHKVTNIFIDPSLLNEKDIDMLQDLTVAAFNVALRKVNEAVNEKMSVFSGGMPGIEGLTNLL